MSDHMTAEQLRAELLRLARYGRDNNPSPEPGIGVHSYALSLVCEKLDSLAARLSALPAQGDGWLPIESAPRDSEMLMLWVPYMGRLKTCRSVS